MRPLVVRPLVVRPLVVRPLVVRRLIALSLGLGFAACASGAPPAPEPESAPPAAEPGPPLLVEPFAFVAPDGTKLVGTLRRKQRPGPAPGIVLIHGIGPLDRSSHVSGQVGMGFGFPIAIFDDLAVGLAERGFAVLAYDKRSCGQFNRCAENDYPEPPPSLTIEDLLADVLAAGDALAEDPAVYANRLILVGHSQGGTLAVHALAARPKWRGAVLLATPHAPVDALFDQQAERVAQLLQARGSTDPTNNPLGVLAEQVRALRDRPPDDLSFVTQDPEQRITGAFPLFWRSWLGLSDETPAVAARLERPLAVIGGSMDWTVAVGELEAWRTTLAGREGSSVQVLPKVTHALNRLEETDVERLRPDDIGRQVAPEVIEAVAEAARQMARG